jgi:hypothetical protein
MQTREEWSGCATDLFNEICVTASPRALSQRLRLIAAALAGAGINIEFHRVHGGIRKITMTKTGPPEPHTHERVRNQNPASQCCPQQAIETKAPPLVAGSGSRSPAT